MIERLYHLFNNLSFAQFSHDTRAIQARHIRHAKRQMIDSTGLSDEHYPTFYGGDFSNVRTLLDHMKSPIF